MKTRIQFNTVQLLLLLLLIEPSTSFHVLAPMAATLAPAAKVAVAAVSGLHATHPLAFAVSLTCAKTAAADFMVQTLCSGDNVNNGFDWKRLGVFAMYGALYLGILQHFLFTHVYAKLFPLAQVFAKKTFALKLQDPAGAISVLCQVMLDLCVHWPFFAIPAYYILQELTSPSFSAKRIKSQLQENWKADVLGSWAIWWPACLYNYGNMPLEWQVPFTAGVSFVYTAYISLTRGKSATRIQKEVAELG